LDANDWRTFRTWVRAALRSDEGQNWLLSKWTANFWLKSLSKMPSGDGQVQEALVNVRVRNSFPGIADRATSRPASSIAGRVQRELDAYGDESPSTLARRCGIMLRPVVLYQHFAGGPPLGKIRCPNAGEGT
jgi:hypothetical protein